MNSVVIDTMTSGRSSVCGYIVVAIILLLLVTVVRTRRHGVCESMWSSYPLGSYDPNLYPSEIVRRP
jgi:hypothetical protein